MKVLGIIAEYNPFHNGHEYQLNQCREMSGADYTVIVLGSDFNQRGQPSIVNKYVRTRMALSLGADLIIEMPQLAASASAAYFAGCGVSLLDHLGVVTHLGFGSESGDLKILSDTADHLRDETPEDAEKIRQMVRGGATYAAARSAVLTKAPDQPNDILATEYLAALNRRKSAIEPLTVGRIGMKYHGTSIADGHGAEPFSCDQGAFAAAGYGAAPTEAGHGVSCASASAIRSRTVELIAALRDPGLIKNDPDIAAVMPKAAFDIYTDHLSAFGAVTDADFYPLIRCALLSCEDPSQIFDISTALSHRLQNFVSIYGSREQWLGALKPKNYTWTRISRCLTHLLLRQTKEDAEMMAAKDFAPYVRILGIGANASPLLGAIKSHCDLPVISKMADAPKLLDRDALTLFEKNVFAARVYKSVEQTHSDQTVPDEYRESPRMGKCEK